VDILLKFSHGLGDAVQLTCVPPHLAKHRPEWTLDIASKIGKHSAFRGQCRRSWILDREQIPERDYRHVFDLGWYECYSVYADSPCTKVCSCLRDVFGIVPDRSLLKYRIDVGEGARDATRRYLTSICNGNAGPNNLGRFPTVAIHYQGNTSPGKKDLEHRQVASLCVELRHHGYIPLILDWDRRSPLPDQKAIFCPGVGSDDLWDNTGTGDAERLAALIGQCSLFVGVDSGPLHVAGATETPTLGVWKGHSPVQFFDLCPNVTHLVSESWRTIPLCQYHVAASFFADHYAHRTYRGFDKLESALIDAALETLAAQETVPLSLSESQWSHSLGRSIRAPPGPVLHRRGEAVHGSQLISTNSEFRHPQATPHQENPMTTAATLTWQHLPGLAREIALGADGSAWCLGMGEMPEGSYSIHRWNGADWDHIEGAAAKIAVGPDGHVWALKLDHHVLWYSAGVWIPLPGVAREIAVGANGSAWCLSSSLTSTGDSSIHVWRGLNWDHVEGAAAKIAVAPDGLPWIVDSAGHVYRRNGEGWELLPGLASEIACGADGSVWCLSASASESGDHSIHVWDGSNWDHVPGAAVKIAAGLAESVWIVNSNHQILRAA
jgi:hypothetical protein